jgi:hypothetical protein
MAGRPKGNSKASDIEWRQTGLSLSDLGFRKIDILW